MARPGMGESKGGYGKSDGGRGPRNGGGMGEEGGRGGGRGALASAAGSVAATAPTRTPRSTAKQTTPAQVFPDRAGQDHSPPHQRQLRDAPARGGHRHQALAADRALAVLDRQRLRRPSGEHESHSARGRPLAGQGRRGGRGPRGFGRNYLVPQKKALLASSANLAHLEHEKQVAPTRARPSLAAHRRHRRPAARGPEPTSLAGGRERQSLRLGHRHRHRRGAGLVGAPVDLQDSPPEPIKALGEFSVEVKLHGEVTAKIKVNVVAEK